MRHEGTPVIHCFERKLLGLLEVIFAQRQLRQMIECGGKQRFPSKALRIADRLGPEHSFEVGVGFLCRIDGSSSELRIGQTQEHIRKHTHLSAVTRRLFSEKRSAFLIRLECRFHQRQAALEVGAVHQSLGQIGPVFLVRSR